MKTDLELQQDVMKELKWEPSINATEIGVAVKDGVVTLSGEVDSYTEKRAAEEAASRVFGVKAVAEEIEVRSLIYHHSDDDIARAAANALHWNVSVPNDRIKIKVENGRITLTGDVDWQYQKQAALSTVRDLVGVVSVEDRITIKPGIRRQEQAIQIDIEDALRRNAVVDAQRIKVEASDSKIILKGSVRSWRERKEAEQAAWSAPGVTQVDNKITVNPFK